MCFMAFQKSVNQFFFVAPSEMRPTGCSAPIHQTPTKKQQQNKTKHQNKTHSPCVLHGYTFPASPEWKRVNLTRDTTYRGDGMEKGGRKKMKRKSPVRLDKVCKKRKNVNIFWNSLFCDPDRFRWVDGSMDAFSSFFKKGYIQ